MTGEEVYEKYKEARRKWLRSELEFAKAVIACHEVRAKTIKGGTDWDIYANETIARAEMNLAKEEYAKMADYLEEIRFVP